jgi:hypothetical protein
MLVLEADKRWKFDLIKENLRYEEGKGISGGLTRRELRGVRMLSNSVGLRTFSLDECFAKRDYH